jgi:hypothetical protein
MNTNDLSSFRYLTKYKRHTEMKLTPSEGELQKFFAACGRNDRSPTMATRRATVDMAVKWQHN